MKLRVASNNNRNSEIKIPASKSLSHRALICAALSDGKSVVRNLAENDDMDATIECLKQLGVKFTRTEDSVVVEGIGGCDAYQGGVVDCHESGSTLRFLIPIFANTGKVCKFTGHGRLMKRPQTVYEKLFETFFLEDEVLHVQGGLEGGTYQIAGDISSQFITGLLFALPMAEKDSVIDILPPFESASYVDLTIEVLEKAGIEIEKNGLKINIKGGQKYKSFDYTVSGDYSQAAFYAVEALVGNREITVHGLAHNSRQGDRIIINLVEKFGGKAEKIEDGYVFIPGELKATEVDLGDCPDLGPALFSLASQAEGVTTFHNTARLRIKESDRIATMQEELAKIGCEISVCDDVVSITGIGNSETDMKIPSNIIEVPGKVSIRNSAEFDGHNDHRVVMALSILAASTDVPLYIDGAQAVDKSYPEFFQDLQKTGIEVQEI